MRNAFYIVTGMINLAIAVGYPFISALRGNNVPKAIRNAWGFYILYIIFLCLLLPGLVLQINKEFGREMLRTWVPDMPGIVAVVFMGWLPPLIAAVIGLALRHVLTRFGGRALARIEAFSLWRKPKFRTQSQNDEGSGA